MTHTGACHVRCIGPGAYHRTTLMGMILTTSGLIQKFSQIWLVSQVGAIFLVSFIFRTVPPRFTLLLNDSIDVAT